jgi:hypothetical protein
MNGKREGFVPTFLEGENLVRKRLKAIIERATRGGGGRKTVADLGDTFNR